MSDLTVVAGIIILLALFMYRVREVYKQNPILFEPIFALLKKETWMDDKK